MSAWLVTNVPSWLLLVGLVVVVAAGAVLIQTYARRRFPALTEEAHNDVTRFAFTVIAFLYAFLSGFLINAMWGQINGADLRAATEGSAAMQQAKSLTVFDQADGDRIRQSLLEYLRAADAEWPKARGVRPTQRPTTPCNAYTPHTGPSSRAATPNRSFLSSL